MLWLLFLAGCPSTSPSIDPPVEDPLPWTEPSEPGPFGVGARTLIWFDAREKLLTAEVWYPAQVEPGSEGDDYGLVSRTGIAHRDADGDLRGAPWPLIAFSHGFGGVRYQSTFLTEHLASHGFVVVAVDHPRNTLFDLDEEAGAQVASERPADVSASVDRVYELASEGWFGLGGLVDPEAGYGMLGHSFGGWTAVTVGGGLVDPAHTAAWCAEEGGRACSFIGDLEGVEGIDQAQPDPRAVATVALAPGAWYSFGVDGLSDVAPFRWVCTSGDPNDLRTTDRIAGEVIAAQAAEAPEQIRQQCLDNLRWIQQAEANGLVVGSQARILYADHSGRRRIAAAFNRAIADGTLSAPVVLGRDHHDVSGTDSPWRETANIRDGSRFCADMAVHNFVGDAMRGASWVSLHNGGGVGWGRVMNGGFGLVLDGSKEAAGRAESMLDWDVANGLARRAWARNEGAVFASRRVMEENARTRVTLPVEADDDVLTAALGGA